MTTPCSYERFLGSYRGVHCHSTSLAGSEEVGQKERGCARAAAPKWFVGSRHFTNLISFDLCALDLSRPAIDEPDEVELVREALNEHLDLDPQVTLGVLCDQLSNPDEPMDEEERAIRERLRTLVISFLTTRAKRAIVDRHASRPGSEAENVLVNGLLTVKHSDLFVSPERLTFSLGNSDVEQCHPRQKHRPRSASFTSVLHTIF